MRVPVWCSSVVLAGMLVACGDQPTEVVPERNSPDGSGTVALATASSDDGLSITTDKDDYAPGDTVWFTGAGWQAADTLDIVLTDDPLSHPPHTWSVETDSLGGFRDSTYIVDTGDLGVTFTLTATSRATGRELTVVFTDGNLQLNPNPSPNPFSPNADLVNDATTISWKIVGSGAENNVTVNIRQGTLIGGTLVKQFVIGNQSPGASGTVSWNGTNTSAVVVTEGEYTARIFSTGQPESGATSGQRLFTMLVDYTPPVISSPAVSPTPVAQGSNTAVTVTGTATDNPAAGVATNKYKPVTGEYNLDGGSFSIMTVAAGSGPNVKNLSATIPGATVLALSAGAHLVCIRSTDDAGNRSADNASGNANCATLQVNSSVVGTTTEVASSANPSISGQSVTFTATVKSGGSPIGAHGAVSFRQGGSDCTTGSEVQAAASLNASGQATYAASFTASGGPYTIRACYGGATGYDPSNGSITQTVNKAGTTTAVGSSVNPSVFSQTVTFTATVSVVAPGIGTPAGDVTFKNGTCAAGTVLGGPITLNGSGQATFDVSSLTVGTHAVTACYAGNAEFDESDGNVSQAVNKALTSTGVTSNANPSVFSQSVTFDVTVTNVAPAVATPAGSVTLKNGTCAAGSSLGTTSLNGSGQASFNISTLAVGTHTITACYLGNSSFEPSEDGVSQVVNKAHTTTAVGSSANPSVFSQTVTFDVTVAPVSPAIATPAGSVTLMDGTCSGGSSLGSATLSSGTASFDISTLTVGTHTVTACYAGNASFVESDGDVSQQVNKASTTTAITSSVNPSILAQPVTFDVTVSPVSPAVATPVGSVTLMDGPCIGGSSLGSATLSSGTASFDISILTVGTHTVTACYAGNASFERSEKSLQQQVKYNFDGLYAPVDRPNTMNVSKAGQAVPLKWRLTDYNGAPVLNFAPAALGVAVTGMQCSVSTTLDQIEEYAGNSGLQNLGDGYYQFNWKTPSSYANSCKSIGLNLGEGSTRGPLAYFNFKK
jgi:hypothetical protein